MPFDDLLTPVAISPVQRHDEPTCCGERQVPDVGEEWMEMGPDEILQDGDEVNNGLWGWGLSLRVGLKAGTELRYRRRVTPVPPAPQSRPAETRATTRAEQPLGAYLDEENNELREQVVTLTAEVERLRLRPEEIACINEFADELSNNLPVTAMVVRDVIKRLGGGE